MQSVKWGTSVVCSERARSQTPPVPPRTVYSHRLLALPPPTNLHRLLLHLLHLLPRSTGAVFWRRLLLPSTRTASSRLLLAPSLPAASSRRFLAPSPSAASSRRLFPPLRRLTWLRRGCLVHRRPIRRRPSAPSAAARASSTEAARTARVARSDRAAQGYA